MIGRPLLFTPITESLLKQFLSISGFEFILFQQIIFTPILALSIILLVNEDNSHQLRIQAEYDSLTCLRNRGSFFSQLRKAANLSSRLKTPLTILTVDLDHFKLINDQYLAQNFKQLCYKKYICNELNNYSNITNTYVDNQQYIQSQEDFYTHLKIE